MLVVIDAGNFSTKYFYRTDGEINLKCFSSVSHDFVPFGDDEFATEKNGMTRVQFNGFDSYLGDSVADFFASKGGEKMYTGNIRKGHMAVVLRIVAALYHVSQHTGETSFDLAVTSPVASRRRDKAYFLETLSGSRRAVVNGEAFDFEIGKLLVAAEGLGAKVFEDKKNFVLVDAGSHTVNILRIISGDMADTSETVNGGTQTKTAEQIAQTVFRSISDIDFSFPIRVSGGKSAEIANAIEKIGYTNCQTITAQCEPYYVNGLGVLLMAEDLMGA